jgi:hypothetical protein
MDEILPAAIPSDEISIDRCRELLGDEAADLGDDEVDRIRRCRAHANYCATSGANLADAKRLAPASESRDVLPFEMTPRECTARPGFQVALETNGPLLISELDDNVNLPRSSGCRVKAAHGIV